MESRLIYGGIALLSACSWALGAILWARLGARLSSYGMNLAKTVVGSLCLGIFFLFAGFAPIDSRSVIYLGLSGILGIAVGDTFFFLALRELGPRRASLMGSLNPAAIAVAAALLLGERPSAAAWAGILATTCGVGWVLWERGSNRRNAPAPAPNLSLGIRFGLLSVLCTAGGVLLAKVGVTSAPTAEAAWLRLLAGGAGLLAWGLSRPDFGRSVAPFRQADLLFRVVLVVLVVTVGGFWLSLVALKHIDASLAGPLNSTAPLFILPLSAVLLKEKISPRTVAGTAVAVAGVGLILGG